MKKARLFISLFLLGSIGLTGCDLSDFSDIIDNLPISFNKPDNSSENQQEEPKEEKDNDNHENGSNEDDPKDSEGDENNQDSFTVEFRGNGGHLIEGFEIQTVKSSEEIVPPTYVKDGYEFIGWDTDISTITSDCEVKAKWEYTGIGECQYALNEDNQSYSVSGVYDQYHEQYNIKTTFKGLPVTKIGHAFEGCTLTEINIPDTITEIGFQAFDFCTHLTRIVIPDSVTFIGYGAFWNCSNLAEVKLSETLYEIQPKAFANCTSLKEIRIPASMQLIRPGDMQPFFGCNSLERIIVDENNPVFHSSGNCLINTADKELISGCKASVIPNDGSVIKIADFAFEYLTTLEYLEIPDAVTDIGYSVFWLSNINKGLIIGLGEKNFDAGTFDSCTISKVFYKGTEQEWNSYIHDPSTNQNLSNAPRYYYCEEFPENFAPNYYWRYENGTPKIWEENENINFNLPYIVDDILYIPEGFISTDEIDLSHLVNCYPLKVYIPSTLVDINPRFFSGSIFTMYYEFLVSPENTEYYAYSGMLYKNEQSGGRLCRCPTCVDDSTNGIREMDSLTKTIGEYSFENAHMECLVFPIFNPGYTYSVIEDFAFVDSFINYFIFDNIIVYLEDSMFVNTDIGHFIYVVENFETTYLPKFDTLDIFFEQTLILYTRNEIQQDLSDGLINLKCLIRIYSDTNKTTFIGAYYQYRTCMFAEPNGITPENYILSDWKEVGTDKSLGLWFQVLGDINVYPCFSPS